MARIKNIMSTDVSTLKKEAKIEDAARLLAKGGSGCVVIVDNNKPIGIVTELDFVKNMVSKGSSFKEPISRIMSSPVTFMSRSMKLDEALKIIDTKKFRRYPVVENGELIGLVTKRDMVNAISDNVRLHRNIQNAVLILFVLFEFFIFVVYRYLHPYLLFLA
ncbi:CBS domain-containing protein [Candidatus Woesearchaeota archaeon]|nr:CBS domain-containing protein [Candidatus Woesearchaeota archaeon]